MSVDLDIVRAKGCTQENLEKWFAGDPKAWAKAATDEGKRFELQERIRNRIAEGMDYNFANYRTHAVMDKAWDQPFYQITPTILAEFIDSDPNSETVNKKLADWGLAHMISEDTDPKTGKSIKKLNLPIFFKVFVPLVRAYVTIRWAKIMNDRRQTPFFKYEPFKQTTPQRVKCEAITDRVQIVSNQYGYYDVMKQSVLKMLHYSHCIQFIAKEWEYEEQYRNANEQDILFGKTVPSPTEDNKSAVRPVVKGEEIKVTTREGIPYHSPHPGRVFCDKAHGKHTINYDYGVAYGGHWKIMRYRELKSLKVWNIGAVSLGQVDLVSKQQAYFNTPGGACTLKYPCYTLPTPTAGAAEAGLGVGPMDRELQIGSAYYGSEHDDQGVLVTEYFERLIPKENGLGDYDCPVWFRFMVAGDGATILYATPLPYNPMIYYGYDADESRAQNASLSLEILPFQDQFSNTLTQIIKTAQQNLANLAMVDEDQLHEDEINRIRNMGGDIYTGLNIFGFSGKKAFRGQNKVVDLLHSYALPKGNVAELTSVLKTILDVLERVLVISNQEVGQAASHEQTREEVRNIAQSTSTRLLFTATPVDIATTAWKRQIYQALMAYGDDDMWAALPSDIPLTKDQLEALGFTYVDKDDLIGRDRYRAVRFSKESTAIDIWTFASGRDDIDRSSDREGAVAMATIVRDLMNNPITAQAIGPDQAIDLANQISQLAGLPRDFKLKNAAPNASEEQQKEQAQAELKAIVDVVMQQVNQQMKAALTPMLEQDQKQDQQLAILMPAVGSLMKQAEAIIPTGMPPGI